MEDKVELKDALEYFVLHNKLLERGKVVLGGSPGDVVVTDTAATAILVGSVVNVNSGGFFNIPQVLGRYRKADDVVGTLGVVRLRRGSGLRDNGARHLGVFLTLNGLYHQHLVLEQQVIGSYARGETHGARAVHLERDVIVIRNSSVRQIGAVAVHFAGVQGEAVAVIGRTGAVGNTVADHGNRSAAGGCRNTLLIEDGTDH